MCSSFIRVALFQPGGVHTSAITNEMNWPTDQLNTRMKRLAKDAELSNNGVCTRNA